MKKLFKRSLAVLLCAVMVLGSAPLSGLVGLKLPKIFDFSNIIAHAASDEELYRRGENVFRANYYLNDGFVKYTLNDYKSPYTDELSDRSSSVVWNGLLWSWRAATFDLKSEADYHQKEIGYYESLLFNLFYNENTDTIINSAFSSVADSVETMKNATKSLNSSVLKSVMNLYEDYDWNSQTFLASPESADVIKTIKACEEIKDACKLLGDITTLVGYCNTVMDVIDRCCKLQVIISRGKEIHQIIVDLYNSCPSSNKAMKSALYDFQALTSGTLSTEEAKLLFMSAATTEEIAKTLSSKIWNGVIDSLGSYGIAISAGQQAGKFLANTFFNASDSIASYYEAIAVYEFEKIIRSITKSYSKTFQSSLSDDTALRFTTSYDLLIKTYVYGLDKFDKFVYENYSKTPLQRLILTSAEDYNKFHDTLLSLKDTLQNCYAIAEMAFTYAYADAQEMYGDSALVDFYYSTIGAYYSDSQRDVNINSLKKIGNAFGLVISGNISLSEDFYAYSDAVFQNGSINLNGHQLIVFGNIIQTGSFTITNSNEKSGQILVRGNADFSSISISKNSSLIIDKNCTCYNSALTVNNGSTLSIGGNMTITRDGAGMPKFYINEGGNLIVDGTVNINVDGYTDFYAAGIVDVNNWNSKQSRLYVENSNAHFTVRNNFIFSGSNYEGSYCHLTSGTVEFFGHVNGCVSSGSNIILHNTASVTNSTLSRVSMPEGYTNIDNNGTLTLNSPCITSNGEIRGSTGTVSLNGSISKSLKVEGNANVSSLSVSGNSTLEICNNCACHNSTLYVYNGSTLSIGGNMTITRDGAGMPKFYINEGGNLIVDGTVNINVDGYTDFYAAGIVDVNNWNSKQSRLYVENSNAHFTVRNNFTFSGSNYEGSYCHLTSGTVEFFGHVNGCVSSGSNIILHNTASVTNSTLSRVSMPEGYTNIDNNGTLILNSPCITSSGEIHGSTGTVSLNGSVSKSLKVEGNANVSSLSVSGNSTVEICNNCACHNSTINVYSGSHLIVGGNMTITRDGVGMPVLNIRPGAYFDVVGTFTANTSYTDITLNGEVSVGNWYSTTHLYINDPNAHFLINNNCSFSGSDPHFDSGAIEIKGNADGLVPSGAEIIFSGNIAQTISSNSSYKKIIITNPQGVTFNNPINVSILFNHQGNKFSLYNNGEGSSFVDYDGDSIKDNEDPMPTLFNANWIEWVNESNKIVQVYNPGDTIIPPEFSKTGYTFAGWDKTPPQIMPDSHFTFNALWNINYYNINWATDDTTTTESVKYRSIIKKPANPTKEGYVFAGWTPSVSLLMPAYDLTYTAKWARTITWNIDGTLTKSNIIPGSAISVPKAEKTGYTFIGWSDQIPDTMPDENLTFIAEFEVNNHQVEWVIGDNIITETYNFGEIIVPPEAEIIDGYVFEWVPDYPATMPDEDLVIYAKWYKIITWIIDNDTIISKYEPGDKITPPEIPLKDGYTVNGWSSDVPEIMPDKDLTFEAVYSDFATEAVDSSLKIIGYSGSEYEIVIPDSIGGYPVTAIGDNAFNCTAETIVIPASITTISGTAFKNVSGLQSIEVDEANEYYSSADGVLLNKDKTSLIRYPSGKPKTEYSIPSTVTGIGQYAFYKCDNLSSVIIPNNVKTIGTYAFAYCNGIITLTIGEGITSIGNYAFRSCTSLDTLYYNAISCQSTGTYNILSSQNAFNSCSALKNVIIGNKVERIPNAFLAGITGVSEIIIPDNVIEIGTYSFYGCKGLKNITLSNSLKSIGNYAFYNCTFTNIELTDSVESIGTYTFANCTGLTNITIPAAVTSIGVSAFNGCSKLISITVDNENETYMSSDGVLFSKDGTNLIRCPVGKSGVYTVPDEVTTVGTYCFTGCKNLTVACREGSPAHGFCVTNSIKYTFISSATYYSTNNKFAYNGHLYEIYNNEKSWKDAKAICEMLGGHLVTITASGEQTQVKNSVANGGKDYYWIGASDESSEGTWVWINGEPFSYTNWNSGEPNNSNSKEHFAEIIKSDGLWNDSPFDSASRGFICEYDECEMDFDFVVENNQITITGYNGNESDVIIPDTILGLPVTSINGTFSGCKFESVTLGVNVNTLSASAFSTCVTLQNIFVDDNNSTFVSENGILYSFDKTTIIKYPSAKNASYYSLPKSVTKINDYAFYNVASLKSINLSNVTRIEQYAFSKSGLTTATIPEGMKYLGKAAFYGCTDLTDVFFNAVNCTSGYAPTIYILITKTSLIFDSTVKNVVFGDNVSVISSGLFTNVSLPKLYIPKSVKEIKACAFYYNSALTDVYYSGTEAEWNSVTKGNYAFGTSNKYLQSATMHYGEYAATFIIDGKIVSQTGFAQGTTLEEPSIPAKQGYAYSMWYPYNTNADKNINIVARYELPHTTLLVQKTLFEGDSYRLLSSSNYTTSKKEWRSSDTRVATVDSSGKVTAIGEGECKIYVSCYGNDLTGEPISSTTSSTIIVVGDNDTKANEAKNNFKAGFENFFHYMLNDIVETIKMIFRYLAPFIPAK